MCYSCCSTTALVSKIPQDISPIVHVWDMMKWELTLSPEPVTTTAEQWVQDAWDHLSQDDIRHLYDCLHLRIQACIAAKGRNILYWCDCLGNPYCEFGLNLLSYTPTLINYLSHQFSIQWTCPWRFCIFFPVVYNPVQKEWADSWWLQT